MSIRRWAIVGAVCITITAGLAGIKFSQIQAGMAMAAAFPEPIQSVDSHRVLSSSFQPQRQVIGEVIAPQQLVLRNELPGKIVAIHFQSGDQLKAGQRLLELDTREERARLAAAKADLKLARLTLKRTSKLRKINSGSVEMNDQARAAVASVVADIDVLETTIDKKQLKAPFDAIAGIHNLDIGQYLQANNALSTLVGINDFVWVDFHLPQTAAALEIGSEVTLQSFDDQATTATGTVIAVDSTLSSQSRQLRYRARVALSDMALKSHTTVTVQAKTGVPIEALSVPDSAVVSDQFGRYVFVLKADNNDDLRAQRRTVEVISSANGFSLILGGIQAGEQIAGNGAFKLRSGSKVATQSKATGNSLALRGEPS